MKNYALDILNKCIDEIKNTTEQEFIQKKEKLGLTNKKYDTIRYVNEDIEIIIPHDQSIEVQHKITEDSMKIKINLEESAVAWNDNFYHVEYEEATNINVLAA